MVVKKKEAVATPFADALAIPINGAIESAAIPAAARRGEAVRLGIDEAGRGPVLGAMTFGTCYWALSDDAAIEDSQKAIDDSKQLTDGQRAGLFERIAADDRMGWAVDVVSAEQLSAEMLMVSPTSLNAISFDATCRLIRRVLERGVNVSEAFVDTVGDPDSYRDRLTRAFDGAIRFTVEKKADALYKCTGAASICAKVCRDLSLHRWVFEESPPTTDRDFGSGYPSDDICKRWLKRNAEKVFGFPSFCRFSWQTTKTALGDGDRPNGLEAAAKDAPPPPPPAGVKVVWDDGDADDAVASTMKITEFITVAKKKAKEPPKKKRKRAHFFRSLESLGSIAEV